MSALAIICQETEDPRRAFQQLPRKHTIWTFSGQWTTDGQGNVTYWQPEHDPSPDPEERRFNLWAGSLVRFDLEEYRRYWGDVPEGIDISDIGSWNGKGKYFPADEQYRQDIKSGSIAR